jgi:hypothetical protein
MLAYTDTANDHTKMLGRLTSRYGVGLTPRGHAALMVQHLEEHLAGLSPDDREYMVLMLQQTIAELTADEPAA